jgi:16S rRNA (guanine527-N7)-methyltransferase
MRLTETEAYSSYGLDADSQKRLGFLGDLVLGAGFNVSGIRDPVEIEHLHFLDSLSLLQLEAVRTAGLIADLGSGGGMPALVLGLALPEARVTAIESQLKKCEHIERVAAVLALENVRVCCARAEDHGRGQGREAYDVVVSRAVAALPVVAECSFPLLRLGAAMVAMKGLVSDHERTQASAALAILGGDKLEMVRLDPFPGSRDRLAYVAKKIRQTPDAYPRRAGVPLKRPLGQPGKERTEEARL